MRSRLSFVVGVVGVVVLLVGSLLPAGAGAEDSEVLADTGSISGVVTNRGTDVVNVFALDATSRAVVAVTEVASDDTYALSSLPAGSYLVYFGARHEFHGPSQRSDEVWPNNHGPANGTPVVVDSDAVTGIDAALEAAASISGTISGPGRGGTLVKATPSLATPSQDPAHYVFANNIGQYTVPGVDLGTYTVQVDRNLDGIWEGTSPSFAVGAGEAAQRNFSLPGEGSNVPGPATAVFRWQGVSAANFFYLLPENWESVDLDWVEVLTLPTQEAVIFDEIDPYITVTGLINGVANRVNFAFGNDSVGRGHGYVLDSFPVGCTYLWFTDVENESPFCDEIRWLVYDGIGTGYDDATFRPGNAVSRQAMASFLYRFAGSPNGTDPTCATAPFTDIPTSNPFCGEIEWMVDRGITEGYSDGSFGGAAPVSRQVTAAFLARFAAPGEQMPPCSSEFSDVGEENQFCDEISWLVMNEITLGYEDGTFKPGLAVSRQAMAAFLQRLDTLESASATASLSPVATPATRPTAPTIAVPTWSDPSPAPEPTVTRIPLG